MAQRSPYDDSKISPEIIRLAVMMYSRFPLPVGSMDARLDTADISDGLTDACVTRALKHEIGAHSPHQFRSSTTSMRMNFGPTEKRVRMDRRR